MCSIYCSNIKKNSYDKLNSILKLRGPDLTNTVESGGYTFLHNLLSMTGEFTVQPFVENDIICLYNGEIYNFKEFGDYKSDGECLIPLYKEHGDEFVKKIEGEFAIVLFDFKNNKIILATDIFKTKPLFFSAIDKHFGCSTYKVPLELTGHMGVQKMPPNTAKVFNLTSLEQTKEFEIVQFNLDQYKDNFDDWNDAFHRSVMKRVSHSSQKIFIGLSSGYDSGAICLELLKNKIPFKAYSVLGTENDSILEERFKLLEKAGIPYQRLTKDQENWFKAHIHILDNTEEFRYSVSSASSSYREDIKMIDDSGSNWLSWVCCHAQKDGRKIYLSGGGADEVFSDYGWNGEKKFAHSNFGGLFPENLSLIFPWNSFYGSTMEAYLAKEEYVAGSYGLEARYPYLDVNVVQEFLNLTNTLKNSVYKNVVDNYLTINNFPYCKGEKRGF